MWVRKLHRMGTSFVLTVPRDVMRTWEAAHVHHVVVTYEGEELRVRPLSVEELMHYPAPEEEEVNRGPVR